jgi:hypothetical protein
MVRRVLEITNLLRALPVYDSVADAARFPFSGPGGRDSGVRVER